MRCLGDRRLSKLGANVCGKVLDAVIVKCLWEDLCDSWNKALSTVADYCEMFVKIPFLIVSNAIHEELPKTVKEIGPRLQRLFLRNTPHQRQGIFVCVKGCHNEKRQVCLRFHVCSI